MTTESHREANRKWAAKRYADPVRKVEYLKYLSEWRKKNRAKVNLVRRKMRAKARLQKQIDRMVGNAHGAGGEPARDSRPGVEALRRSERETIPDRRTHRTDEETI